jgi:hypothetical protein
MATLTGYDIIVRNGSDALTGLVEDVTIYSPEFFNMPVVTRAGSTYKTLNRLVLPTAQFRSANQGISGSSSTYKAFVHEMFGIDVIINVDELVAKMDDGVTGNLLYHEGQGALQQVINTIGSQTWYGQGYPTDNGFVGLRSQLLSTLGSNPGQTPVTASANTTSSTVYGLWHDEAQGVHFDMGKDGEIAFPPFVRQQINGANGLPLFAWVSNINCLIGLAVPSVNSVFGVTGVLGATYPFTDKLGTQLLSTVPLTRRNNFKFWLNRSSLFGLQNSRTSINYQPASDTGAPAWPNRPTLLDGKELVVTDNITNVENNS